MNKLNHSISIEGLYKLLQQAHLLDSELSRPGFEKMHYSEKRNQVTEFFDYFGLRDKIREIKLKVYYEESDLLYKDDDETERFQDKYEESQLSDDKNQIMQEKGLTNKNQSCVVSSKKERKSIQINTDLQLKNEVSESDITPRLKNNKKKQELGLNQINEAEEIEEDSKSKKKGVLGHSKDYNNTTKEMTCVK